METLSVRLSAILDAAVARAAIRLAQHGQPRMSPASMDELRSDLELAIRAAALEGARSGSDAAAELVEARITKPGFHVKKTRAHNF